MQIGDFSRKYICTTWELLGIDKYRNITFGAPTVVTDIWYTQTSALFKDKNGTEIVAKYKIMVNSDDADKFAERNYVAFGDHSGAADPFEVDAHEIKSARLLKVPFSGFNDEFIVMV